MFHSLFLIRKCNIKNWIWYKQDNILYMYKGLVSLFNGSSKLRGLFITKAILVEELKRFYQSIAEGISRFMPFPMVLVRLEFKLTYFESAV